MKQETGFKGLFGDDGKCSCDAHPVAVNAFISEATQLVTVYLKSIAVLALFLLNAAVGLGQILPSKFDYKRETDPRFQPSPNRREVGSIWIEGASVEINKLTFDRLVKARNVSIRCGPVRYILNKDNIDALIYFGAEISNDLRRRGAVAK